VPDVLFSSSEQTADVAWWTPGSGGPTGPWTEHTIAASVERCHTLQAADMDNDGDVDVVAGQMHTSRARQVMVFHNLTGDATSWGKQVIAKTGLHNGVIADIDGDGDLDLFGSNWTGNPPLRVWMNRMDPHPSLADFTCIQISRSHERTFGLGFGDLSGDGRTDIVSGACWYQNPGGDLAGRWQQSRFPSGMQAFAVMNVDDDGFADVIAQKQEKELSLYWLEARNAAASGWDAILIGSVPTASHPLGAQGYRVVPLEKGGKPEIVVSSGEGIFYFRVPTEPASGNWPRIRVSRDASDEGFGVGDVDGDADLDIVATTGDSKRVEWATNPGDGSADWNVVVVGQAPEAGYLDRCEVVDLNGDSAPDILVSEENGLPDGAATYWWENPRDPTGGSWPRHLLVRQATTQSMDAADLDGDGDTDVVLGEHRGLKRVKIFENDGSGLFSEHEVDRNKESHLGTRLVDLDADGDLDIVSIGWDEPKRVYVWRNDSRHPVR
jgi:hypothetical protein